MTNYQLPCRIDDQLGHDLPCTSCRHLIPATNVQILAGNHLSCLHTVISCRHLILATNIQILAVKHLSCLHTVISEAWIMLQASTHLEYYHFLFCFFLFFCFFS